MKKNCLSVVDWHLVYVALFDPSSQTHDGQEGGFTAVVVYLDDFFICAPTLEECAIALNTLIRLSLHLGFCIN